MGRGFQIRSVNCTLCRKPLSNGHRTIVLAADNNFTANTQANQFIVFEVLPD